MSTTVYAHHYKSNHSLDSFKLYGNIGVDDCKGHAVTSIDGSIKASNSTFENLTAYATVELNQVTATHLTQAEVVEGIGCTLNKVRAYASASFLLTDVKEIFVNGGSISVKSLTKKTTLGKAFAIDLITLENVEVTEYAIAGKGLKAKDVTAPYLRVTDKVELEDTVVDKLEFIVASDSASINLKKSVIKELQVINPSDLPFEFSGTFPKLITSPKP